MQTYPDVKLFINGEWRDAIGGETLPVIDPATEEVIATVAQGWPAEDDTYLLNTDMETLVAYADFAEANDMLLFLDLQIGRNTVPAEIEKVRSLLERPYVHLALDLGVALEAVFPAIICVYAF